MMNVCSVHSVGLNNNTCKSLTLAADIIWNTVVKK